jgi:hypothetical protein
MLEDCGMLDCHGTFIKWFIIDPIEAGNGRVGIE